MQAPHKSLLLATALLSIAGSAHAQAKIDWGTGAKDITGPSNVSTNGLLCIALNCGPEREAVVINGVHFQADRTHWQGKYTIVGDNQTWASKYEFGPQVCGAYSLDLGLDRVHNQSFGNTGDPMMDAAMEFNHHARGSSTASYPCVIDGLVVGHKYELQIFAAYGPNTTGRLAEWDDGMGNREGQGGVFLDLSKGQYITGTFTATATSQTFTCYQRTVADNSVTPPLRVTQAIVSMIQIRDLTNDTSLAYAQTYGLGTAGTKRGGNARNQGARYPAGSLGGSDHAPFIRLEGAPVIGSTVNFTAENSVGRPTQAAAFIGLTPADIPFLGGKLLTGSTFEVIYFNMPFNAVGTPHTYDHEFKLPITIPNSPGLDLYIQVGQLDPGAPQGVSFSAGMKMHIGR